jgi:hypothetical protein
MFVAEKLVYLELQKTGGTHLLRLLEQYIGGQSIGKHNRMKSEYSDRFIMGSIRNPWDWYVSLWAYGIGGNGAIRSRTLRGVDFMYYHRLLPKAMGKNWLTPGEFITSLYHDAYKPVARWQKTYQDSSSPDQFRDWLKMILDSARRFDIGEGYAFSPLSVSAGLMTYRYFRLFTLGADIYRDRRLANPGLLGDYDVEFNISNGMVRLEELEEDFIRLVTEAGYTLKDDQLEEIRKSAADKTNASARRTAEYYYDDETIALVKRKERFLIEKYGYVAPELVNAP